MLQHLADVLSCDALRGHEQAVQLPKLPSIDPNNEPTRLISDGIREAQVTWVGSNHATRLHCELPLFRNIDTCLLTALAHAESTENELKSQSGYYKRGIRFLANSTIF